MGVCPAWVDAGAKVRRFFSHSLSEFNFNSWVPESNVFCLSCDVESIKAEF